MENKSPMSNTFSAFVDDFHSYMTRDPNDCVLLGVEKRLNDLPNPSLDQLDDEIAEARRLVARAKGMDRSKLDFDNALDLDLAMLQLESDIYQDCLTFNDRLTPEQMPEAGSEISEGIFMMYINDPRPDEERLANIEARLAKVPDYLDALIHRLDTPVRRWVETDLDEVAGLPELFTDLQAWADRIGWPDAGRLRQTQQAATSALKSYVSQLEAMPTTDHFHLTEKAASSIVSLAGIEPSLNDIHHMAVEFLADTGEVIEELRERLCFKYGLDGATPTDALQLYLNQRFAVSEPGSPLSLILDRYKEEQERVLAFIRQQALFPIPDNQELKILRTPGFMEPSIPAGAMEPPVAFREGRRTSLVYLTLSEELRNEHTELSIPNMMIHEGIPGHHLQLATAAMHPSVVRRHVEAQEHAEGWTTMLEDYMLDIGYMGELTDEVRFSAKRDISRLGARVAIDLFFMTGIRDYLDVGVAADISPEDPFEAAGNLLTAVTGFVPGRVQAELNWYSQERGYPLSYLTGNRLVWQLKNDVSLAQRGRVEGPELDRLFHRHYLESGNMPLSFLRRVFVHEGLLV
jgi:uncharacterized protein (DUF885 family)